MASSLFDFKATSSTQITMATGGSAFTQIVPIKGQCGLWISQVGASGGLEIAGGGVSIGAQGFSLINGVTVTYNFVHGSGSTVILRANGTGFPLLGPTAKLDIVQISGAPYLWLSAGNSCVINLLYLLNEAISDQ